MEVDVFAESAGNLEFAWERARVPIFEYTIVCDVSVTEEKAHKRGAKPSLRITKQQLNKVAKHMEDAGKRSFSGSFLI